MICFRMTLSYVFAVGCCTSYYFFHKSFILVHFMGSNNIREILERDYGYYLVEVDKLGGKSPWDKLDVSRYWNWTALSIGISTVVIILAFVYRLRKVGNCEAATMPSMKDLMKRGR